MSASISRAVNSSPHPPSPSLLSPSRLSSYTMVGGLAGGWAVIEGVGHVALGGVACGEVWGVGGGEVVCSLVVFQRKENIGGNNGENCNRTSSRATEIRGTSSPPQSAVRVVAGLMVSKADEPIGDLFGYS